MDEGQLVRFRCRVGRTFSADNVLAGQTENVEEALWFALRTLEERVQLSQQLAARARRHGLGKAADRYAHTYQQASEAADTLKRLLVDGQERTIEEATAQRGAALSAANI